MQVLLLYFTFWKFATDEISEANQEPEAFFFTCRAFWMFSDMLQLTLLTGRLTKVCLIQALLLYEAIQQYDDFF